MKNAMWFYAGWYRLFNKILDENGEDTKNHDDKIKTRLVRVGRKGFELFNKISKEELKSYHENVPHSSEAGVMKVLLAHDKVNRLKKARDATNAEQMDMTTGDTVEKMESAKFVLCAEAKPNAIRCGKTVDIPCDGCGILIILSEGSPVKPKKLCIDCATKVLEQDAGSESFSA